MKDEDVVHFFNATLSETRDYMDGLRQIWNQNLDKYLCIKDFGKKKDWQFKVYTPFAKPKSKRAASIITSILLKGDDIFDFETPKRSTLDPQYQMDLERCNYTKRLLKAHLGSKTCDFYEGFREIMEACFGFTGIMIGKMWVVEHDKISFDAVASKTVVDTQMGLKFKAIDPGTSI